MEMDCLAPDFFTVFADDLYRLYLLDNEVYYWIYGKTYKLEQ